MSFGILAFVVSSAVALASVSVIDGNFDTESGEWTASNSVKHLTIAGDSKLSLDSDNLAPYYSASGGTPTSLATALLVLSGMNTGYIYEVSFDFASVAGYRLTGETDPLLTLNPGGIQLMINGAAVDVVQPAPEIWLIDPLDSTALAFAAAEGLFSRGSVQFTAPGETATMGLRAIEAFNSGPAADVPNARLLIDQVTITFIAIPETGVPCLLLAAAGFFLRFRKRLPSV